MSARTKQWTGRIRQAAGSLAGNRRMERRGAVDRRSGEAGERLAQAKGRAGETIDRAVNAVKNVIGKGRRPRP